MSGNFFSGTFIIISVLTNNSRCKVDGPFKVYSPTRVTILFEAAIPHIPPTAKDIFFGWGAEGSTTIVLPRLPPQVTHLDLRNVLILDPLPPSLTHFSINSFAEDQPSIAFPPSITHFKCYQFGTHSKYEDSPRRIPPPGFKFPPFLTHVTLVLDESAYTPPTAEEIDLPPSVTHFDITCATFPLAKFPPKLEYFRLIGFQVMFDTFPPFPDSLKTIQFEAHDIIDRNEQPIFLPPLPPALRKIQYPFAHAEPLPTKFPPNLEDFYTGYNQIVRAVPPTLKVLRFVHGDVGALPPNIKELSTSEEMIKHKIPPSATTVGFRYVPSPRILQQLPLLTTMSLHLNKEHRISNLPPTLRCLYISSCSFMKVPWPKLPDSLTDLSIAGQARDSPKFPPSLVNLKLDLECKGKLSPLPESLKYLRIGDGFLCPIAEFPPNLKYLVFDGAEAYPFPIPGLPVGIKYLCFKRVPKFTNCIPSGLLWFRYNIFRITPPPPHIFFHANGLLRVEDPEFKDVQPRGLPQCCHFTSYD